MRAGLFALVLIGCVPTLSQPRGEGHLDAMAEASRHHAHGRDADAAEAWERAAESAERRVDEDEAEWRRAQALRRIDREDEALALLDRIAARRPISRRTVRARFESARIRLARGERDVALGELRAIVREQPEAGSAGHALAILVQELSSDASIALLEELDGAVAATDLGDDVLTHLAAVVLAHGDRDRARSLYERVVVEHPYPEGQRWDDAFWRLADIADADGDPRAAIAYLERMLAPLAQGIPPGSYTLPQMPEAGLRIARTYRDALRDPAAAMVAFRSAYDRFPDSLIRDDALVELGELQLASGALAEGCATLRRALAERDVGSAARRARDRVSHDCQ